MAFKLIERQNALDLKRTAHVDLTIISLEIIYGYVLQGATPSRVNDDVENWFWKQPFLWTSLLAILDNGDLTATVMARLIDILTMLANRPVDRYRLFTKTKFFGTIAGVFQKRADKDNKPLWIATKEWSQMIDFCNKQVLDRESPTDASRVIDRKTLESSDFPKICTALLTPFDSGQISRYFNCRVDYRRIHEATEKFTMQHEKLFGTEHPRSMRLNAMKVRAETNETSMGRKRGRSSIGEEPENRRTKRTSGNSSSSGAFG